MEFRRFVLAIFLWKKTLGFLKMILDGNWKLASLLWHYYKRLSHILVEDQNENQVVLSCGIAGVVYVKKKKENIWQSACEEIRKLFFEIKKYDIQNILENKNSYVVSVGKKEELQVHKISSEESRTYCIDEKDKGTLQEYVKATQEHQEEIQVFLNMKSDKQKSKDKNILREQKKRISQAHSKMIELWSNVFVPLVQKTIEKPQAQIIPKKFQHYLSQGNLLLEEINQLKQPQNLYHLFQNKAEQEKLSLLAQEISDFAQEQLEILQMSKDSRISSQDTEYIIQQNNFLLDSSWSLQKEILDILVYIEKLLQLPFEKFTYPVFEQALAIASVLRGLDKKLETRGRDSCGLSVMLSFDEKEKYDHFLHCLEEKNLQSSFQERQTIRDLANYSIDIQEKEDSFSLSFTYKIAKAIGQLGDNVQFLKGYLWGDLILAEILQHKYSKSSVIVHTRWASQGVVSIENCHPVDNKGVTFSKEDSKEDTKEEKNLISAHIYAALNGDIDNNLQLRDMYLAGNSLNVSEKITTDAKSIPITIEHFFPEEKSLLGAFRRAVNEFRGSFAIQMHSDLEPGKIYLAQQGKGQGLYVGISPYGYHVASEIYGFVEQTNLYIPMEPGQIFILDQNSPGNLEGIQAFDFGGKKIELAKEDLCRTPITTRDIFLDTTQFSHFLEKEIHESPEIVAKTLRGKWEKNSAGSVKVKLGEEILPYWIRRKIAENKYRRFLFVGMGTAHAAAEAVAANFQLILGENSGIQFESMLATEFTASYHKKDRSDHLVIAISQSGGTTDTNAAVRKLAEDNADLLAIVNKRDSDMTFLVDGILYTGDGRDVEIAVASTKAFYAQVVAGTLYALNFAEILQINSPTLENALKELLDLPSILRKLFERKEQIAFSARELAPRHIYWDTLSTGVGYPVAKEIKIKLSELCYMSIPEFFAANKKHINLSAEAMILCFFGALQKNSGNQQSSLVKDLQGEISIFLAQDNVPIVFTTEDDESFDEIIPPEKKDCQLLKVIPPVSPYLCVILNTAAGHLWSYYAAKALNQRAVFISQVLDEFVEQESHFKKQNYSSTKMVSDRNFQSFLKKHYQTFREMIEGGVFHNGFSSSHTSKLEKLFLAAMGIIPASASPIVFGQNWGTDNILKEFKSCLTHTRTWLTRSIDAIKHQAKYITVGVTGFEGITSMPSGSLKDILLSMLQNNIILANQEDLNEYDMITLSNIQKGIDQSLGGLMYLVSSENDQTYLTTIENSHFGSSLGLSSRYDKKNILTGGRKAMAVLNSKVHIGRDHDSRNLIVIPLRFLGNITKLLMIKFSANENISGKERIELLGGINSSGSKAEEALTVLREKKEELLQYYKLSSETSDFDFFAHLLEQMTVEDLLILPHEEISERMLTPISKKDALQR